MTTFIPSNTLKQLQLGLSALALIGLSACSTVNSLLDQDSVDYKSSKSAQKLEVPPDLTQIRATDRFSAGRLVSASNLGSANVSNNSGNPQVLPQSNLARIERAGNNRFLVVNAPAEQVFPTIVAFWKDLGFTLAVESPQTGILETDWAENRAKGPASSGIRKMLGGIFDSVFDSGERDKYRTRIERVGNTTEVYISHRGTKEVSNGSRTAPEINTISRDGSVELESDFLRRLLLKFGTPAAQANAAVGVAAPVFTPDRARLITGKDALELDDNFDTAWRRVGLALDRSGFTIEDRNYSTGEYFVRYARSVSDADVGFFSKIFSSEKERRAASKVLKLVLVRSTPTVLMVQSEAGGAAESDLAKSMLNVMRDELK